MTADPGGDALLWLFVVQSVEMSAICTPILEDALDPLMARSGDLEVDRVDRVRYVEAVILLVPMAVAAFNNLDARPRLGGLPFQCALVPSL